MHRCPKKVTHHKWPESSIYITCDPMLLLVCEAPTYCIMHLAVPDWRAVNWEMHMSTWYCTYPHRTKGSTCLNQSQLPSTKLLNVMKLHLSLSLWQKQLNKTHLSAPLVHTKLLYIFLFHLLCLLHLSATVRKAVNAHVCMNLHSSASL